MRYPFELVDLVVYLLGVGLILPAIAMLDRGATWTIVPWILLLAPFPFHVARLRCSFPSWLDNAMEKDAYLTLLVGIGVVLARLGVAVFRWVS